jgi:PLP dependent protein
MNLKDKYLEIKNEVEQVYQQFLKKNNFTQIDTDSKKKPKIIAVSKTFSYKKIEEVFALGQFDFAENYVNEFEEKYEQLLSFPIKWHFIGHLQTNKVDKVVGKVEMIQSVDNERVLKKIIDLAEKKSIVQNILLQVKFGNEDTKHGFALDELDSIIQTYKNYSSIKICGLMCILPLGSSEAETTKYFSILHENLFLLKQAHDLPDDFKELSMGMSGDFKLAILEGSTMIRIGSAIFGARL